MKYKLKLVFALMLLALNVYAQPAARLWIHVQTEAQKQSVENLMNGWLNGIDLNGRKIVLRPTQLVPNVPQNNQLRFFKKQDAKEARLLFKQLRTVIPNIQLKDFSDDYDSVSWVKSGHYELWLNNF